MDTNFKTLPYSSCSSTCKRSRNTDEDTAAILNEVLESKLREAQLASEVAEKIRNDAKNAVMLAACDKAIHARSSARAAIASLIVSASAANASAWSAWVLTCEESIAVNAMQDTAKMAKSKWTSKSHTRPHF